MIAIMSDACFLLFVSLGISTYANNEYFCDVTAQPGIAKQRSGVNGQ